MLEKIISFFIKLFGLIFCAVLAWKDREDNFIDQYLKNHNNCRGCPEVDPLFPRNMLCKLYGEIIPAKYNNQWKLIKAKRLKRCKTDSFKEQAELMADIIKMKFKEKK